MTFINPALAFAGLACIALPILIHLLMRRRRRPIPWAAMRFLMEAYKRQKRRLTLEQLLLLAARCLLIALVAIAIGRPVLGEAGLLGQGAGGRTLYILFDDSLTSAVQSPDSSVPSPRSSDAPADPLVELKRRASGLLAQLDASRGDRAALITLAAPAQAIITPASSDLEAVRRAIAAIEPTAARSDVHAAIDTVRRMTNGDDAGRTLVAMVSSMRAGAINASRPLPALEMRGASMLVVGEANSPVSNTAITSVEPLRRVVLAEDDEPASITLRVAIERFGPGVSTSATTALSARTGSGAESHTLVPWSEGQRTATASIAIVTPPGVGTALLRGERTVPISLRAQTPGDLLSLDDERTVVVTRQRSLRVGLQGEGGRSNVTRSIDQLVPADWLRLALAPDSRGPADDDVATIRTIDLDTPALVPARLGGLDALVLTRPDLLDAPTWARLADFARGGRLVLVTPPSELPSHAWADAMIAAFDLPWQVQRQSIELAPAASPVVPSEPPTTDVLRVLRSELASLLAPVNISRMLAISAPPENALLAMPDGRPLLLIARMGNDRPSDSNETSSAEADERTPTISNEAERASGAVGTIALLAVAPDLSWTDLPARPLMVPLAQELVRQGVASSRPASEAIAGAITPPADARELRDESGAVRWSTGPSAERTPRLLSALDEAGRTIAVVAVQPDTRASDTSLADPGVWSAWLTSVTGNAPEREANTAGTPTTLSQQRDNAGESLALTLLLCAAAVAVFELALARFASHATIARGEAGA
ncbi:MAG: BatA domain-containing protein [Phycisphaerales bacterium]|jgi:hypothetical protein|nr:BatA domain-containing protein [Phycisphaerales bacterium]